MPSRPTARKVPYVGAADPEAREQKNAAPSIDGAAFFEIFKPPGGDGQVILLVCLSE